MLFAFEYLFTFAYFFYHLFNFCHLYNFCHWYIFSFRVLIYSFQFTVNRRKISSFSICFLELDLHQIKFNPLQSLFSLDQLTSVDYCKVFSYLVLCSIGTGKFSQMLLSGRTVTFFLNNSLNLPSVTKQFDENGRSDEKH